MHYALRPYSSELEGLRSNFIERRDPIPWKQKIGILIRICTAILLSETLFSLPTTQQFFSRGKIYHVSTISQVFVRNCKQLVPGDKPLTMLLYERNVFSKCA